MWRKRREKRREEKMKKSPGESQLRTSKPANHKLEKQNKTKTPPKSSQCEAVLNSRHLNPNTSQKDKTDSLLPLHAAVGAWFSEWPLLIFWLLSLLFSPFLSSLSRLFSILSVGIGPITSFPDSTRCSRRNAVCNTHRWWGKKTTKRQDFACADRKWVVFF